MTDLSPEDRRIADSLAETFNAQNKASLDGFGDIKDLLCTYWPKLKALLELVLGHLPAELQAAVKRIIAIVDMVFGTVCPR